MKISEAMTRDVLIAHPDQTICDVAKLMAECDTGALPVGENDRLVGVITDRDIVVRALALNKGADTSIRDIMSREVLYCFEDEDTDHVLRNMGDNKIRRLPVLDRSKRLVGIVSIGDLALSSRIASTGEALADISRPGGAHSQLQH